MKTIITILALFLLPATAQAAQEKNEHKIPFYAVSSDEISASDSLNRISGHYDLGFSSKDQSFDSSDHYAASPFGRQESVERNS